MKTYIDGATYLELHALRAPVGNYRAFYGDDHGMAYSEAIEDARQAFEEANGVSVWFLGRSGRHVCIDDTPRNRRRYRSLQRKAIDAAHALWQSMLA